MAKPTNQESDFWPLPPLALLVAIVLMFFGLTAIESTSWAPVAHWLRVFPVGIHEMGHALGCQLTGGHVGGMIILPFEHAAGETWTGGGWNFLYTQTGYLGLSIVASVMLLMTGFPQHAKKVLIVLGSFYALAGLYYMGAPDQSNLAPGSALDAKQIAEVAFNAFWSRIFAVTIGGLVLLLGARLSLKQAYIVVVVIAIWFTAAANVDILGLFDFGSFIRGEPTNDAQSMQNDYFIHAKIWAGLWLALSNLMFGAVLYYLRRLQPSQSSGGE